jgi:hypothetical protein
VIKMIYLCRRLPAISREDYAERVLQRHVPLAIEHHPSMRHYVVNIAESDPDEGPELDALPALYFDSLEDHRERLYDSAEGQEIIRRDVETFLDSASAYITSERIHKDDTPVSPLGERSPGIKWMCPIKRPAGMTRDEFVDYWIGVHAPLVLKHQTGLVKYVSNVVEARLDDESNDWDGFAELHFEKLEDLEKHRYDSSEGERRIAASRERFIGRSHTYSVGEYIQK